MRLTLFYVFAFLTLCFGLYNVSGYLIEYFHSNSLNSNQENQTTAGFILGSEAVKSSPVVSETPSIIPSPEVTSASFTIKASNYGFPKQFNYCYIMNGVTVLTESSSDVMFLINSEKIKIGFNGISAFHSDYLFLKSYTSKNDFSLWLCSNA